MVTETSCRTLTPHQREASGFTLIELLMVIVIIAILAAIAIPQFSNTKESAYIATMESKLQEVMTAQDEYFSEHERYTADLSELGVQESETVTLELATGDSDSAWSAVAEHANTEADCAVVVNTSTPLRGEYSGTVDTTGTVVCSR